MKSNQTRAGGKSKAVVALCVLLAVTILLGIVGFTGLSFLNVPRWLPTTNADNWPDALPLGLDLQGGVYVEYTGEPPAGSSATFEDLVDGTISIIRQRLSNVGQTEANIQRIGTNGIRVEIPIKRTQSSAAEQPEEQPEIIVTPDETSGEETPAEETPAEETPADTAAEETPAEAAATEEVPAEETPAEVTVTEDAPTEAAATEEVPAEETLAEVTVTEETPTEAAATEEVPAEETPAEVTVTEETPAEVAATEEVPAEETPAEVTVTEETPAEEAPASEEAVAEETASGKETGEEEHDHDHDHEEEEDDEANLTSLLDALIQDGNVTTQAIDFSSNDDIKRVLDLIGTPAVMRFVDPEGNVFMEGDKVKSARYVSVTSQSAGSTSNQVEFQLTDEGAKIFGEYTTKYVNDYIAIYLDSDLLVYAKVNEPILNGSGLISGNYTAEEAQAVAAKIQSGALPLVLTQDKVDMVSATLGQDAVSSSVKAALIGILLIMVLMIIRYRLNGAIASWALTIYVILLFGLIALFKVQLTLPGLAGVVLGIGMAVDANVIIFERFNEEARRGRSAKASVRAGFKNAMSAILDANVTTLIAAIVLLIFGTGSIQGFARTLLLGVVVSMFTAILVTRFLMNRFVDAGATEIRLFAKVKAEEEVEQ